MKRREQNPKEGSEATKINSTESSVAFSEHSRSAKPTGYAEAIAHSCGKHGAALLRPLDHGYKQLESSAEAQVVGSNDPCLSELQNNGPAVSAYPELPQIRQEPVTYWGVKRDPRVLVLGLIWPCFIGRLPFSLAASYGRWKLLRLAYTFVSRLSQFTSHNGHCGALDKRTGVCKWQNIYDLRKIIGLNDTRTQTRCLTTSNSYVYL